MKLKGLLRNIFFNSLHVKSELFRRSYFGTKSFSSSLCAWEIIGSFEVETCTFQYAPQLNWRAYNRTCFFNGSELYVDWNFPEAAIFAPKVCSSRLYAWGVIGSFEDEICMIGYAPQLNWNRKACNITFFFAMVLNYVQNWKI